MKKIRITKEFTFETGHAPYGYDGKCRNVHGHSYHLSVTVIGQPIANISEVKLGMVMDFGDLKKVVKEEVVDPFDHATVFNKNTRIGYRRRSRRRPWREWRHRAKVE